MASIEDLTRPDLPKVLVLYPPLVFTYLESEFSKSFHFIKAYDSPLALEEFLSTSPEAFAATALFSSASKPRIDADVLRHLPSLRVIVTSSAGVNHIDLSECRCRGITVANAGAVFSDDVADTAIGLVLDVLRKISAADRYVRGGRWSALGEIPSLGNRLSGKTVGIVGLGKIGSQVAKRLQAFGCKILYYSRSEKKSFPYTFYSDIHELSIDCSILVLCCALNEQTKHLIDKQVLSALGREGVVVNVARGAVIHEKELVRCLVEGEIAGAGLDVFEEEPFVPNELREMDNVVLTPHLAVNTLKSVRGVYEQVTGNLKAFFSNHPLLSPVLDG